MNPRRSLRTEFTFHLAFLAGGAVLIAFGTARALQQTGVPFAVVVLLVVASVAAFTLVGNYLLDRWVVRPLADIGGSAEAIAEGDFDRRVPENGPAEIVTLARALNHLTDQLLENQRRLAENVRSLDDTNRRLTETQRELVTAEKMASLGRLAAGVAHEIGNPLGAVMGYVAVQRRRGGDPELADGIEREARRIDRIVRDLLDYARPTSSAHHELDVNAAAERVVAMLRDQGWLGGIEIDLNLSPDSPPVVGDPHRIDQIFVNLLRNAESAMDGRGRIRIATARAVHPGDQPVPARRSDDPPGVNYLHLRRTRSPIFPAPLPVAEGTEGVRISISDTGPGIPEEMIDSIFDPFVTTKAPGEGSGLGLAIVAGTVNELGGRIDATSTGAGATFSIWFPAARIQS